ncbi:hypothetical protein MP228_000810 [Amoeboaphelidium protococcarum]|nr:hypothetical protein MP228_000810 [Amoeboaphelidium protococcarum]
MLQSSATAEQSKVDMGDSSAVPKAPPMPTIPVSAIVGNEVQIDDPVHVINLMFPNEQSFSQLDSYKDLLIRRIDMIDREVKEMIQPVDFSSELAGMSSVMLALRDQIKDIKSKAQHAERTVQDITKDIKSLDLAKRNLTSSILLLKRLSMLSSGLDQLRNEMSKRNYHGMSALVGAVLDLAGQFKEYKNIQQISDLLVNVNNCQQELRRLIFSVFESSFTTQGALTGDTLTLREISLVADSMEPEVRRQLIDWYTELQLKEYRAVFRYNEEVGSLDNVARRYAWLKRLCKTYDDDHVSIFPESWEVSKVVCERFSDMTKEDISSLLVKSGSNIDVKLLIKSLQITLEFESGLNKRFLAISNPDFLSGKLNDNYEVPSEFRIFDGKVSGAFEPYLRYYVDAEERSIQQLLDAFKQKTVISDDDIQTGVFSTSTDLFLFYRQTLVSMSKLNTRQAFVDLSKAFTRGLSVFGDLLSQKLPKEDKRSLSSEDLKMACLVLNTAEYCSGTTLQLEEKIKEKVDAQFKESIDLSREQEAFLLLTTTAIQCMVKLVMASLNSNFVTMSKLPWSSMQNVGDQSDYVTQIGKILTAQISTIRKLVFSQSEISINGSQSAKQFRWFCDKFVDTFVPTFMKHIHLCKPISEIGAEQLLLDTHGIKTILLDMPNMGAEQRQPASAVFTKFVTKSIAKAETLLKVVLTHLEPPDVIIKNYLILCAEGAEEEMKTQGISRVRLQELRDGFFKILELKGVSPTETQSLLDLLQKKIQSTAINAPQLMDVPKFSTIVTSTQNAPSSPTHNQSGLSSIASGLASIQLKNVGSSVTDAGSKFNENLMKKIGGSWLKRDPTTATQSSSSQQNTNAQVPNSSPNNKK